MHLADLTWPDVDAHSLLAVPVGSCEQHGPHLPLDTDTRIALALADRLATAREDVMVAPAVAIGASGEHAGFPGTLSIGTDGLSMVLVELIRSARRSFGGVVLVSGHGGNAEALARAASLSTREGDRVLSWSATVPGSDAHAGRTETSVMLALDPDAVRLDRAAAGSTAPVRSLMPLLRRYGVRDVSPNGVLGDPAGASAEEGCRLLDRLAGELVGAVDRWQWAMVREA